MYVHPRIINLIYLKGINQRHPGNITHKTYTYTKCCFVYIPHCFMHYILMLKLRLIIYLPYIIQTWLKSFGEEEKVASTAILFTTPNCFKSTGWEIIIRPFSCRGEKSVILIILTPSSIIEKSLVKSMSHCLTGSLKSYKTYFMKKIIEQQKYVFKWKKVCVKL